MEWELPRVLKLEKKRSEHLKWTHLEPVQHSTDLTLQITFAAHTEQEKMEPGLEWTLPLIDRTRRMIRRPREKQEKREKGRPISKRLPAALLRSFRGQHDEKMVCVREVPEVTQEGQQLFRPNPNGVGNRTTTLRRLLICANSTYLVAASVYHLKIELSVLLSTIKCLTQEHNKQSCRLFISLSFSCWASGKETSNIVLKSIGMPRNRSQVHRLQGKRADSRMFHTV